MASAILKTGLSALIIGASCIGISVQAQDFQYQCRNEPVRIEIPGDRLDRALEQLRLQTRCPISGTRLARGKRSRPIVGTMVPEQALQAMLNNTGLEERPIRGGFEIIRTPRR